MTSIFPEIPESIIKAIKEGEHFFVIGHKKPDGDCVFSSLAMREMLLNLGKSCLLLNDGPFNNSDIRRYEDLFSSTFEKDKYPASSKVIVVDCSTSDRVGKLYPDLASYEMLVFDHHSSGQPFTSPELSYIVPFSPSTTLVLEKLREALELPLTKTLAEYLYKGFLTDTGYYHFLSEKTGPEALAMASGFASAGVSPYVIYDELHDGKTLGFMHLAGTLLERTEAYCGGRLLVTYQKKEERSSERPGDSIYAELLQVENVKMILFFKEDEGSVDIGIRSKNLSGIDSGAFAASFGGGGHFYAAGATVSGSLPAVMKRVIGQAELLVK